MRGKYLLIAVLFVLIVAEVVWLFSSPHLVLLYKTEPRDEFPEFHEYEFPTFLDLIMRLGIGHIFAMTTGPIDKPQPLFGIQPYVFLIANPILITTVAVTLIIIWHRDRKRSGQVCLADAKKRG